jgi:hypothetical protein
MNKVLRNLAIAVAVALIVALILTPGAKTSRRHPEHQVAADAVATKSSTVAPNSLDRNRRLAPANDNTSAQSRAGEEDEDMIAAKESLRSYRSAVGENPIGTNAEITKALAGGNARKARFTNPDLKIKNGEIVDRWEHPLFFHQLSRTEMEIRSAGPDGIMWTKDDEVLN